MDGSSHAVVTKLTCETEAAVYRDLMDDAAMCPHIARLFDVQEVPSTDGSARKCNISIEDVTAPCLAPCVMDIKLGASALDRPWPLPTHAAAHACVHIPIAPRARRDAHLSRV